MVILVFEYEIVEIHSLTARYSSAEVLASYLQEQRAYLEILAIDKTDAMRSQTTQHGE